MLIDPTGRKVDVEDLQCEENERLAIAFLRGAVYAWCNAKKGEEFRFATFAGGDNYYWEDTELYYLYERQEQLGTANPILQAAGEGGKLLRYMLSRDKRTFKTWKSTDGRWLYAWEPDSES